LEVMGFRLRFVKIEIVLEEFLVHSTL
jgi:hypothetical protein